ncbi:hypothetical protein E4T44_01548 [Aureobasidium sp. EXF-8845]|nr:hypothetical protein E4T44_01548 [Aureobasidium sp. EXF-8845]KAI4856948.1 hypothetical protein E4T45_01573 [Aureobasidium sp. EXF-8846]
MGLGGYLKDPSTIINHDWSRVIQIVAMIASGFSIIGTLVVVYWFFMMRRNFRRNLIMYLMLADLSKSLWYLCFSSIALRRGSVRSSTVLCQGFGFCLQASTMACDFAVLIISMHMYLQVFSFRSRIFGHDGLYRFRHTVMALWFILPVSSGLLAFVGGRHVYLAQGPFCTLPIRPFWYRLALQWIPRYLIWLYVIFVAFRIYLHVGQGLKVFARGPDDKDPHHYSPMDSLDRKPGLQESLVVEKRVADQKIQQALDKIGRDSVLAGSITSHPPIFEHFSWPPVSDFSSDKIEVPPAIHSSQSSHVTLESSKIVPNGELFVQSGMQGPASSGIRLPVWKTSGDTTMGSITTSVQNVAPIELRTAFGDKIDYRTSDTPLQERRRAIQRRLRLQFIYPVVYLIMWIIPFIYHSMYYSDYYAAHPIPILATLSTLSLTSSGFLDCVVFGWREQPWRHIPGADGTFLGSFAFWSFGRDQKRTWSTPVPDKVPSVAKGSDSVVPAERLRAKRPTVASRQVSSNKMRPGMAIHKKTYSGTSDRATLAAEQAAERLALEMHDYQAQTSRRSSWNIRRGEEWFERSLSDCIRPVEEKEVSNVILVLP